MSDPDPDVIEFMSAVMRGLGVTRTYELANEMARLGVTTASASNRTASRWISGHNGPSFNKAMALMRAAGMLNQTGRRAAEPEPAPDRLAAVEAAVERMTVQMTELVQALSVVVQAQSRSSRDAGGAKE